MRQTLAREFWIKLLVIKTKITMISSQPFNRFSWCITFQQQFIFFFWQTGAWEIIQWPPHRGWTQLWKHLTMLSIRLNSPVTLNLSFMMISCKLSWYFQLRLDLDMRHLILIAYFLCFTGDKITETWHKKSQKSFFFFFFLAKNEKVK